MIQMNSTYCCELAWKAARDKAWMSRDFSCGCDHNESCEKCYPLDFRKGGKWHLYKPTPESTWVTDLRKELMLSKMTHNFTFSRDEVMELLGMTLKV